MQMIGLAKKDDDRAPAPHEALGARDPRNSIMSITDGGLAPPVGGDPDNEPIDPRWVAMQPWVRRGWLGVAIPRGSMLNGSAASHAPAPPPPEHIAITAAPPAKKPAGKRRASLADMAGAGMAKLASAVNTTTKAEAPLASAAEVALAEAERAEAKAKAAEAEKAAGAQKRTNFTGEWLLIGLEGVDSEHFAKVGLGFSWFFRKGCKAMGWGKGILTHHLQMDEECKFMHFKMPIFNKTMWWEFQIDGEARPLPPLGFNLSSSWEDGKLVTRDIEGKMFDTWRYMDGDKMKFDMEYALKKEAGRITYVFKKMEKSNTPCKILPPGGPFGHGNYKKAANM